MSCFADLGRLDRSICAKCWTTDWLAGRRSRNGFTAGLHPDGSDNSIVGGPLCPTRRSSTRGVQGAESRATSTASGLRWMTGCSRACQGHRQGRKRAPSRHGRGEAYARGPQQCDASMWRCADPVLVFTHPRPRPGLSRSERWVSAAVSQQLTTTSQLILRVWVSAVRRAPGHDEVGHR
jgi:hypothetical protein